MQRITAAFLADERGVTAVEYGLIAALLAVVLLFVLGTLSDQLNLTLVDIKSSLAHTNDPDN